MSTAPRIPAAAHEHDAIDADAFERQLEARLAAIDARLAAIEALGLGDLVAAHRSGAAHARHLDAARETIETAARAAVERARETAKAARSARDRELAGDRVRIRPVGRALDVWTGSARLRLDPANRRGDSARLYERAAWLALVASSGELAALVDSGAILVEDLDAAPEAR